MEVDESLNDKNTVFANLDNNDDEDKYDDYNSEYVYEEEGCTRDSNDSLFIIETSEVTIKHQTIGLVITKVRKTFKMFKKSPTKNESYLQKYVKVEFGNVIMDCKTRWSSLLLMLEIFDKLKNCVKNL